MVCAFPRRTPSLHDLGPADQNSLAMKPHEITEKLQLAKLKDRLWYVQPSVAPTREGLDEGFDWLSERIKQLPKK